MSSNSAPLIASIALPGIEDLPLHGLVVFIGPNSSGKTQLLQDLRYVMYGEDRTLVVAQSITIKDLPPLDDHVAQLVNEKLIECRDNKIISLCQHLGRGGRASDVLHHEIRNHHVALSKMSPLRFSNQVNRSPYFAMIGSISCSAMFLAERLLLLEACPTLDKERDRPQHTLQSLFWDLQAQSRLQAEIRRVFRRAIWVGWDGHHKYVCRVTDSAELPDIQEQMHPALSKKYRTMDSEGDGLRSYSAICATLLLGERALCLIDEPEMCLHPPQAYNMGRFIAANADRSGCVIVSTHSSNILRGMIESGKPLQIVRLTRRNARFMARILSSQVFNDVVLKPRSRSESVLEGALSDAVVLCESEGDRLVYEAAFRTSPQQKLDIRLVSGGGTGGFAEVPTLYRSLRVPVAVIADIDFLAKDGDLRRILRELGASDDLTVSLTRRASDCISEIRKLLGENDAAIIASKLAELIESVKDGNEYWDSKLRKSLSSIQTDLDRIRPFKDMGMKLFENKKEENWVTTCRMLKELLGELSEIGLFLVPCGQLESWVPVLMHGIGTGDKSKWALLAAQKIEGLGWRNDDIWSFVERIIHYLNEKIERASGSAE